MSSKVVTPPNDVRSAYEDFIEAFVVAGLKANLEVYSPQLPLRACFTDPGDRTAAVFKRCLYLKGWPCRKLARSKRLDIVIKAVETFKRPSWLLTKSTVYVNYVVVSNCTAKLAQSLHYDFVDNVQANHPFFHVQFTDEVIQDEQLPSTGFKVELSQQPSECSVTTRIPTPDMTLASVLYCLVADHLGAGQFKEFADKVACIQRRLPHPGFDALKQSLQKSAEHFKSSHWFVYMS